MLSNNLTIESNSFNITLLSAYTTSILHKDPTSQSQPRPTRPWDFGEITLLILLIFGTFGNLLTIMVMRRKRLRNTNASLFVICIAISDMILLVLKFLANMIKIYRVPIYDLCIFIQVIPQAASLISIWLIIITSAERTVAVTFPLKVQIIFSKIRCKTIMLFMIIFFIGLSSTTSICIHHSKQQPYYCQIRGDLNGTCFYYYTYVFPWFKSIFGSWVPSLLGITLNLVIIRALYKAANSRKNITTKSSLQRKGSFIELENLENRRLSAKKSLSRSTKSTRSVRSLPEPSLATTNQSKEKQITIMLLTISLSFIILTLPYAIFELLRKLGVGFKILKSRTFMRVCMMLIDINHATNFILFCLTAQRFRTELKKILFPTENLNLIKNSRPKLLLISNKKTPPNSSSNHIVTFNKLNLM